MSEFRQLGEILVNDILPSLGVSPKTIEKIESGNLEDDLNQDEDDG